MPSAWGERGAWRDLEREESEVVSDALSRCGATAEAAFLLLKRGKRECTRRCRPRLDPPALLVCALSPVEHRRAPRPDVVRFDAEGTSFNPLDQFPGRPGIG